MAAAAAKPAARPGPARVPSTARLLHLQATAGNRAVQRMVARGAQSPVQREMAGVDDFLEQQASERRADVLNAEDRAAVSSRVPAPARFQMPPTASAGSGSRSAPTRLVPASVGAGAVEVPAEADEPAAEAGAEVAAPRAAAAPAPLKLPDRFRGEDRQVGWRAKPITPEVTEQQVREHQAFTASDRVITKYNTPGEQRENTLTPAGGRQTKAQGGAADLARPAFPEDPRATEYAMGPEGNVVANVEGGARRRGVMLPDGRPQEQRIHHSTMLAGGDVAHAGHIGTAGGKVNYLDDDSGHYQPTAAHTFDAFNRLGDQGVLDKNSQTGRVNLVDKTVSKGGARGASADVSFSAYSQTGGDEAAIRAKGAALDQIEPGRFEERDAQQAAAKRAYLDEARVAAEAQARAAAAAQAEAQRQRAAALAEQQARQIREAEDRAREEVARRAGPGAPPLDREGSIFDQEVDSGIVPDLNRDSSLLMLSGLPDQDDGPEFLGESVGGGVAESAGGPPAFSRPSTMDVLGGGEPEAPEQVGAGLGGQAPAQVEAPLAPQEPAAALPAAPAVMPGATEGATQAAAIPPAGTLPLSAQSTAAPVAPEQPPSALGGADTETYVPGLYLQTLAFADKEESQA